MTKDIYDVGDVIDVICDEGFEIVGNFSSIICQQNFTFQLSTVKCVEKGEIFIEILFLCFNFSSGLKPWGVFDENKMSVLNTYSTALFLLNKKVCKV